MPGPRRSRSVELYLWESRAAGAAAVLLLVAGIVSDRVESHFWDRHALVAGLASSAIVVVLTVVLVNEIVERRRRRRWSVLAQYVMLQLVRDARGIWSGLLELAGLGPPDTLSAEWIDAGGRTVRDTERLTAAVRRVVAEPERRRRLQAALARNLKYNDEVLGRWAGVMLNADVYAEIIDRHVELASELAWVGSLLDNLHPSGDDPRQRVSRSHPAFQVEGAIDDDQLTQRLVSITQFAEELDRSTLDLALRVVSLEWWAARLVAIEPGPDPLPDPTDKPRCVAPGGHLLQLGIRDDEVCKLRMAIDVAPHERTDRDDTAPALPQISASSTSRVPRPCPS
jgi:hypothetical protein